MIKNLPAMLKTHVQPLVWEDLLEWVTHCSILAWKIPQADEPEGVQSMRSQRVGHDWVIKTFTSLSKINFLKK